MGNKSKSKSKPQNNRIKKRSSLVAPEPYVGYQKFLFENGDVYIGYYNAERNGKIWREGEGSYLTHDGDVYEGKWKDDKLDENEKLHITYKGGDEFFGNVKDHRYQGAGTFKFSNGLHLICEFDNNKPIGDVIVIDKTGKCWHGHAERDAVFTFNEHIFFANLDNKDREIEEKFIASINLLVPEIPVNKQSFTLEELETIVFGKSYKTALSLDFETSNWYKEYLNRKNKKRDVVLFTENISGLH